MKVCLIKPPVVMKAATYGLMPSPPLGLAYVAAAIRQAGHDVQVIDSIAASPDTYRPFKEEFQVRGLSKEEIADRIRPGTQVVALGLMFTNNWVHDRELITHIRACFPAALIIAGGEHVTAVPEYCLRQVPALDALVLGEGEETAVGIVAAWARGEDLTKVAGAAVRVGESITIAPRRERIRDLEAIPWPAWDLFPVDSYIQHNISYGVYRGPTLPIMASRGCPYDCTFCSSPQMWGRRYDIRSPKDVADEMEHLHRTYGIINFDFFDLTAIIYKEWIIDMAKEIIGRGLRITWQIPAGTRAEAIDKEVAEHLYASGCRNITYAPESGSPRILKLIRKKVKPEAMLKSIADSHRAGLNIKLNMIIGFPDEQHGDVWRTLVFLIKCAWHGADDAISAIFSPYPGSHLFQRLEAEGELTTEDDTYVRNIVMADSLWPGRIYNKHMSPTTVKLYAHLLLLTFYGTSFLFRPSRIFSSIRNIASKKYESRSEMAIGQIFHRRKAFLGKVSVGPKDGQAAKMSVTTA